ncbi:dirigent protein 24-like [Cynara cardunculus var. scolymus]|uniref:dirigent protein 24-like n=1 Tax=Cynara cardunculus var. scolymus TaxID=59895 RepID=UPI000D62EC9E|nr:dirigent protein 24-like [Cynara cardunculus var. scolymus]
MAISTSAIFKTTICILFLTRSVQSSYGTRILIDTTNDLPPALDDPLPTNQPGTTGSIGEIDTPHEDPTASLPSGQIPATVAPAPVVSPAVPLPATPIIKTPATNVAPVAGATQAGGTGAIGATPAGGAGAIGATPAGGAGAAGATKAGGSGAGVAGAGHPTLSFFMHDVLGGSQSTSRVVTGIVASSSANVVPFSTPNSQVFPITGGVPLNDINGIVNNNNLPYLAGFNGNNPNNPNANTVLQNTGNNNVGNGGNNLPFVAAGQLPAGITLQQLMFGSITVIDNEITEGHELGTGVLGRGQGFYLSSSLDGSSHTFALTTLFHGSDHEVEDTISFFGVHRTASEVSHIAVIGGTGKYEEAKGYATIESLPQVDEHTTDGVETIVHVNIYLTES